MFKDVLEFQEVKVYVDLPKNEMIKELQSLKTRADQKRADDILVVAVVNVSFHLDLMTYQPHENLGKQIGYVAPTEG